MNCKPFTEFFNTSKLTDEIKGVGNQEVEKILKNPFAVYGRKIWPTQAFGRFYYIQRGEKAK
jgi:hypothetical protein